MTIRTRGAVLLAVCGIALLAASGPARGAGAETLRLEDVVRLHVSGVGTDELIARIRVADVDFDLSDAMLEELRVAGLPEPVVQAMIERQNELHPPPSASEPPGPEAAEASYSLVVHLHLGTPGGKHDEGSMLRIHDAVPPGMRQRLRVDDPKARIDGLAVFVGCLTATHVPDHWRMESPLGRDFEGVPRHRVLAFVSTDTAAPDEPARGPTLRVPPSLTIELDPRDPHAIVAGIAVRLNGRFYVVSLSGPYDLVPAGSKNDIDAWISPPGPDPESIRVTLAPTASSG